MSSNSKHGSCTRLAEQLAPLVVLSLLGVVSATNSFGFGKYWVYAEKMYQCEPKEAGTKAVLDFQVSKFDVKKPQLLQTMTGTLNTTKPLAENTWVRARVDAPSNGGWKLNALVFTFKDKGCSVVRTHMPQLFRVLFKMHESQVECFVPPGVYTLNNELVNWTFPKFPVLPYGFYRFHITLGVGEETYACHNAEGWSVPRKGL